MSPVRLTRATAKSVCVIVVAATLTLMVPGLTRVARKPAGGHQHGQPSLAERLGYPKTAKLLIIHADDLGLAHSVDAASWKALETGSVNSASVMVPCPWFSEAAEYAQAHPDADLGLHLVLTSEWAAYHWGPVLSIGRVRSLLNRDGYLYPTEEEAAKHIDPAEAELEIRAQVERALAFGMRPTHLDSHMGTLIQNRPLLEVYLRAGHDYHLPLRLTREVADRPEAAGLLTPSDIVIDREITITPDVQASGWADFYRTSLKTLGAGVTEFVIHLAYDDSEMRAITVNHPDWGAAWRRRDYDFFTSEECRKVLQENGIKLITWREIGRLLKN
ncbi:MAG TPA: polysaccharide deacetylase family protein [Blastocatellia bacterium]|nr:polysaccharide deacetylase family protein [Blastocatellia bacterium]